MSQDACVLTTKDLTILEVMLDRCLGIDDPMAPLLRRKIDSALVVFRDDVPGNVATLSSRVLFRIDGRDPDTRILSHDRMNGSVGMFLPITTFSGLALLGLTVGQAFSYPGHDGLGETVRLDDVLYQPETAKRERELLGGGMAAMSRKPALRLIRGAHYSESAIAAAGSVCLDDEPDGPSAA